MTADNSKDVSSDSTGCSARMKRKSSQPPTIQCIFCDEKEKDFSKKSEKQQQSQKLHAAGEFHTSFQKPNVQHVNSLTEKWRDMACFLGDTNILSKLDSDVKANVKRNMYPVTIQLRIKSTTIKSDMCYERAIAVGRTIDVIRQEAYEKPESPIEVRYALDVYNSFLSKEGVLVREYNITRFDELILHHTNDFEIHKNSHNVNVFILNNQYVKSVCSSFDESMKFLRDARKVVSSLRESMNNMSLKFDKEFEQTNSIPPELISLIGLLIENNSSSTSALQSTLTISRMIVDNFKKRIRKGKERSQNTVVNQNQLN